MSEPQESTDPTRPIPAQPEVAAPIAADAAAPRGEAAAEGSVLVEEPYAQTPPPPYGMPVGGQGAPAPAGTDGMAIAGLVLAFLAWPVGLGLSIAALVRTRRSGRPGKGLAIGGIVVSALAFVGTVISVIFFVTAGIALVEAEEERVAAASAAAEAAEAAAELEAAEEAAAAAAETEAAAEAAPPVVEGSLLLPASVEGLTGVERGCEILFADDPNSLFAVITSMGEMADEATLVTATQLLEAARTDLGAAHEADANALLAIFQPETYMLAEAEMTTALTEGSAAADRLAVACGVGL